jgi:hypothetical protein
MFPASTFLRPHERASMKIALSTHSIRGISHMNTTSICPLLRRVTHILSLPRRAQRVACIIGHLQDQP